MGSYYQHKQTLRMPVPYSFRCESCGKDSGPLNAMVQIEATLDTMRKDLNAKESGTLHDRAEKLLVQEMKSVHKDVTEKNVYPNVFIDKCPHCGAPQSWAVSGLKKEMYSNPIVIFGVGLTFGLIGLVTTYVSPMEGVTPALCFGIIGVGAIGGLLSLAYNVFKIKSKTKATSSSAIQNLPEIHWDAVQDILNSNIK